MSEENIFQGDLYQYGDSMLGGVFVKEEIMHKVEALRADYLDKVRHLLSIEAERGNVYSRRWTLRSKDENMLSVWFINTKDDIRQSIKAATTLSLPKATTPVFIASSYADAEQMADEMVASKGEP